MARHHDQLMKWVFPGQQGGCQNCVYIFLCLLLIMAMVLPSEGNAQTMHVSLRISPKTTLMAQSEPVTFNVESDTVGNNYQMEGAYTFSISSPENQQVQVGYTTVATLNDSSGANKPMHATSEYSNEQTDQNDWYNRAGLPGDGGGVFAIEDFRMQQAPVLADHLPGQPAMLHTTVNFTIKASVPGGSVCQYCTVIQIQIEYN